MKFDGRDVLDCVSAQACGRSEPDDLVTDGIRDWPGVQGMVGDVDDGQDCYNESN